jgi:hypothetical protein
VPLNVRDGLRLKATGCYLEADALRRPGSSPANLIGKSNGWKSILNAVAIHNGDGVAIYQSMTVTTAYTESLRTLRGHKVTSLHCKRVVSTFG